MIARIRQTLLSCAAATLTAVPAAAQQLPSNDSLTALIRGRVGNSGVGMVLGVIDADGKTRIVHYGSAGLDAKPLDSKSLFEIGSITKVFTGILLADLVDRRLVSLQDPVAKHLPTGVKVPTRNGREITLLDIATHRSSLTRMPTNMVAEVGNPYPKYTIEELYAYLGEHQLRRDIGSEYEYSNIAVALLGHVIERVAGKPYEELVQERILRPLGMTMTTTRVEGPLREWMTVGHAENGMVAPYRGWQELPGMGALRSNAEDLLRFIAANTGPPESPIERVMRSAREVRNNVNANTDIGLNWQVLKFGNRKIIEHGGATQGFRAFLAFDPETRVGAVVLANYPAAIADIVLHLINPNVPLSTATVAEREEVDVAESVLRQYAGDYELRPDFSVNVTFENGALFVQPTGQSKAPIFAESQTKFFLRAGPVQLTFTRDQSGSVTGLTLHQGGREQPARRRVAPGVPLASADAASLPGRKISISSRLLSGERALRIVTPPGYDLSQSTRYPVLYVLETERPLNHVATVSGSVAQSQNGPDMIVVHVSGVPTATERAAFVKFLSDELRPWVAREYRTAPFGVLVGTADVLAATTAFQAEVVMGADLTARASLRGQQQSPAPSTDPHAALRESLNWLFDGWALPDISGLAAQPGTGWATIDAHFAKLSERFGFTAVPREDIADNAAGALIQQRRYEDAIRVLEKNRELHPGSAVTWNHLGDGYRVLCRWPESKEHYTKAHELAKAMSYSNLSNYVMELSRITQEIESGRPCTSPTAPRPSVAVAEAILRTFVGEYAFSPTLSIVITLEEGTLYAQPSREIKRVAHAESETKFFVENSPIQFTFTKDASGAVTGMTVHQGGRDVPGRKVK